ncbi:MAG: orotidine-5'-phosphate decarboxylase [Actinobacteria bacterium]|nr:orotidine-5'-phosphate decarboxylase [Actinomycetota bacterium]
MALLDLNSDRRAPVALALDAPNLGIATAWAVAAAPYLAAIKIGLESYLRDGASGVRSVWAGVEASGAARPALFLDLKLHDIPNTVAGAARSVADLAPDFLTVHALGGPEMIAAAAEALPETRIVAVTVLTSMDQDTMAAVGIGGEPTEAAVRLARMAVQAGARALVCSPLEVAAVREAVPAETVLITPGVRPTGSAAGDQRRIATPEQAWADGADLLVIGRPITGSGDVAAACQEILELSIGNR